MLNKKRLSIHYCADPEAILPFDEKLVCAVVTGKVVFRGKSMKRFPNLKIITPYGVGVDNIDLQGAKKLGITVTNAPKASSRSVAELTLFFILALFREAFQMNDLMKKGAWRQIYSSNLFGKNLGIIGLGNIGKEVARLTRAFDMNVAANDVIYDENFIRQYNIQKAGFKKILETSDLISLHVPLTDDTRGMMDKKAFSSMKRGAYFVNTARGALVDEKALLWALEKKQLNGAALDVFSQEPPKNNRTLSRILAHQKVVKTPHVASWTRETHDLVGYRLLHNIISVLEKQFDKIDRII